MSERPELPPLSEMRSMTPDERREFDEMRMKNVRFIGRTAPPRPTPEQIRDAREAATVLESIASAHGLTSSLAAGIRALLRYVEQTAPTRPED